MLNKQHHYPRRRIQFDTGEIAVTKQSHKDECDIYRILNQYQRTGIITHVQKQAGRFEDLPDPVDYQTALNIMAEANQAFSALPAKVRDHFSNDPANFLAAFEDPKQHDQLREFGFLKPKEAAQDAAPTSPTSPTS